MAELQFVWLVERHIGRINYRNSYLLGIVKTQEILAKLSDWMFFGKGALATSFEKNLINNI